MIRPGHWINLDERKKESSVANERSMASGDVVCLYMLAHCLFNDPVYYVWTKIWKSVWSTMCAHSHKRTPLLTKWTTRHVRGIDGSNDGAFRESVLSHAEPICVIQRVIMENRPFSCGHQTASKQPPDDGCDRDETSERLRAKCRPK